MRLRYFKRDRVKLPLSLHNFQQLKCKSRRACLGVFVYPCIFRGRTMRQCCWLLKLNCNDFPGKRRWFHQCRAVRGGVKWKRSRNGNESPVDLQSHGQAATWQGRCEQPHCTATCVAETSPCSDTLHIVASTNTHAVTCGDWLPWHAHVSVHPGHGVTQGPDGAHDDARCTVACHPPVDG
jgi:hypothetical protein